MSSSTLTLDKGTLLEGRYRLDEAHPNWPSAFVGRDERRDRAVIVFPVSLEHGRAMKPAVGVNHPHLTELLAIVEDGDRALVVAEHVAGETLLDRLAKIGKKAPVDAVRSTLRVVDALTTLHQAGAVHGLVHPAGVVLEPEGREPPLLTFRPAVERAACRSPERSQEDTPSAEDDSYAAAALLFEMLTGKLPPAGGFADEGALADDVADADLQSAILHALTAEGEDRAHELKPFKRELARWYVKHAGEELVPHHTGSPPPLPAGAEPELRPAGSGVPAVVSSPVIVRRRSSRFLVPLAVAGILLGLGAAWAVVALRPDKVLLVQVPKQPPPAGPKAAAASEIKLGDVPVTGKEQLDIDAGNAVASCVAGYLPNGSFAKPPDVGWLCSETDAVEAAGKLRSVVVTGGGGTVTDAMKTLSRAGWFDMAILSVVRSGCCEAAAPLRAPAPSTGCEGFDPLLQQLGGAVTASGNLEDAVGKYEAAARCEFEAGKAGSYHQRATPQAGEAEVFREFVKAIQSE